MSQPDHAVTFAVVAVVFYAAHQVGDYWTQTSGQAMEKGLPGWKGRRACASHVWSYTLTLAVFLAVSAWWLGLPLGLGNASAGLAVSGVTHYIADRRKPLERIAAVMDRGWGKLGFYRAGEGLATGAALLDQAWHYGWLLVSALVVAGGPHG